MKHCEKQNSSSRLNFSAVIPPYTAYGQNVVGCRWGFGDGVEVTIDGSCWADPRGVGQVPAPVEHTYSGPGVYVVRLTLYRANGSSETVEGILGINAPAITGRVFWDNDYNGVYSMGDVPIHNTTVKLYRWDDVGGGDPLERTADGDGVYTFIVERGRYRVEAIHRAVGCSRLAITTPTSYEVDVLEDLEYTNNVFGYICLPITPSTTILSTTVQRTIQAALTTTVTLTKPHTETITQTIAVEKTVVSAAMERTAIERTATSPTTITATERVPEPTTTTIISIALLVVALTILWHTKRKHN